MKHSASMKGRYATETTQAEKLMLTALAVSLLFHLLVFGLWKLGREMGWWRQMGLPRWMQVVGRKADLAPARKRPDATAPDSPPLVFIDTDPALAVAEPPKNAKFYSSDNTLAANPTIKTPSDVPLINGTQTKVIKTIEPGRPKAQPLQPSPPEKPKEAEKPQITENKAEAADARALPKPSFSPGDLAMAKPKEKPIEKKGQADAQAGETAAAAEPQRSRPRTLAEAMQRQGLDGAPTRQAGGVPRLGLESSFDTARTPWGDYDRDFIEAVRTHWYQLLADRGGNTAPGRVKLEFKLHQDGSVSDMRMTVNEVTDLLGIICQEAVMDPSPFKRWTEKMKQQLRDPRDITFTFYYESE
jgi:outer membrane biosynthesis protein TonB